MPSASGVSVALPVFRADPDQLRAALDCIRTQTHRDLDIMVVLNGADAATGAFARAQAGGDARIRVLELARPSLAAALNAALREAFHPLVARMDADDLCPPDRLARQVTWLENHPQVVALGTAYQRLSPSGAPLEIVRPPCEPRRIRWRLCVDNAFCHGSMVLRRDPILAAGGYDETCQQAQDYELWLRLSRRFDLANLPEVLYQHRARSQTASPSEMQAVTVARAMLARWRELPRAEADSRLEHAVAAAHRGGAGAALEAESILDQWPPTREALMAWLLARSQSGAVPDHVLRACQRSRLREVGSRMRGAGIEALWLWGAGDHTSWVLDNASELGVPVRGLVDDFSAGGRRCGRPVLAPDEIPPGDHALLSSGWHEEALWQSSARHRARGVHVWRLYADGERL
jgi:hypothetical protein